MKIGVAPASVHEIVTDGQEVIVESKCWRRNWR